MKSEQGAAQALQRVRVAHGEDSPPDPHANHEKLKREHSAHVRGMHLSTLWVHFANVMLGAWLAASPFAFGLFEPQAFTDTMMRVTAERNLADPAQRMLWLAWSDMVTGAAIILFGALSLSRRFSWAQWANGIAGVWLLFAPLLFWSPSAAVYIHDTLIGALVIAFALLVPMMPGMSRQAMMDASDLPVGWSFPRGHRSPEHYGSWDRYIV